MEAAGRKLIIEVIDAHDLLPIDGTGTSSPYVAVDFHGQLKRTRTVHRDLNPVWEEILEFSAAKPRNVFGDLLEAEIYHDRSVGPTRRNNFLGRIKLNSSQFVCKGEEALIYYPLERKSLFNWVRGEIGLKIYYVHVGHAPPPQEPPEAELQVPYVETTPELTNGLDADAGHESETKPQPEPELLTSPNELHVGPQPQLPEHPQQPENDKLLPCELPENLPELEPIPPEEECPQQTEPVVDGAVPIPESGGTMQAEVDTSVMRRYVAPLPSAMSDFPHRSISPPVVDVYPKDLSAAYSGSHRERSSFDLVDRTEYLFVRVVKTRSLPSDSVSAIAKIEISGCMAATKPSRPAGIAEWNETFAFGRDSTNSASTLEVSVWDSREQGIDHLFFLGGVCFDVSEIPNRVPPDSPLAPRWYRLEGGDLRETPITGDIMLSVWFGTQADESFPESWHSDTSGGAASRSKVYLSPKLWYLRVTVMEAQDLIPVAGISVRVQLGFQTLKTRKSTSRTGSLSWNEDLMFVAAEPFDDRLVVSVEFQSGKDTQTLGSTEIPLTEIERRVDNRTVDARWFNLVGLETGPNSAYKGRIHLRLCFDGGYHVMDEWAHLSSDFRSTARQLWRRPVGKLDLGIIRCRNLSPMKNLVARGSTDAYCVAKFGEKWVRTRTITNKLDPIWNEQYTWQVYDPCNVLTVCVFDNRHIDDVIEDVGKRGKPETRLGKIRIRVSLLESGKIYRTTYPLLLLLRSGLKQMGEIDLAVRFTCTSELDLLRMYRYPTLPSIHYLCPIGSIQQEALRRAAVTIIALRLSRAEPVLRHEAVLYMLEADAQGWSMRRTKANWNRIMNVLACVVGMWRWMDNICRWTNPTTTVLSHFMVVLLVCFSELLVPTFLCYLFFVGTWNFRYRPREPPHLDPKLSCADIMDVEDLDEEFDPIPTSRSVDIVYARYDKLRILASRVQTVLGDIATQAERVQALVCWRDPFATGMFILLCLVGAMVLYLVPAKVSAIAITFYYLRHPMFRDPMPPPMLNFFRRLPALSERII